MTDQTVTVNSILQALTSLTAFAYTDYVDYIKDLIDVTTNGYDQVCTSPVYGERPGLNSDAIQNFKVATVALGLSRTSGYDFANCVNTVRNKILSKNRSN
jgi:hypothetical protein